MASFIVYHVSDGGASSGSAQAALAERIAHLWTDTRLQFQGMWLIHANTTADHIRDELSGAVNKGGGLLVARVGPDAAWFGLPLMQSDWIAEYL
jgi:hypothetical protein